MTISTFEAAKTLGHFSDWRLSNLQMQKILYLAHMFYMGRNNGDPLVDEEFQAWDYGPVLPSLYHKISFFGRDPVKDVFFGDNINKSNEAAILKEAAQSLANAKPGALVNYTHKSKGAWDKNYVQGARKRIIPNCDILEEYRNI